MTDRHSGYIVILEKDIRRDDAKAILNAISMVKGVLSVKPVIDGSAQIQIAQMRERGALQAKLYDFVASLNKP